MTSTSFSNRFSRAVAEELQQGQLSRSLLAGLLIYVLGMIVVISFAALIFAGALGSQVSFGLGILIVGNAFIVSIIALLSSYGGSIANEQDTPTAVLAITAASIVAAMAGASQSAQLATVIAMIVCTSLVTGLIFVLLGAFRLGGLVRFLPYPVMGGFLAGTGWLLTVGGLGMMVDVPLNQALLQGDVILRWLPGVLLGALMLYAVSRFSNPLILPALFIAGIAVFYLITALTGTSIDALIRQRWLLGPFPSGNLYQFPLSPGLLGQVDWHVLIVHIPSLLPIPAVAVISVLLNANGIELLIKRDIDLNRELFAAGIANLIGGVNGASVGFHTISFSGLNHVMADGKRLPGILAGALMLVTAFVGASVLGYIPREVLGAILVFFGLALLYEWIVQAWSRFSRIDFAIIVLITVVIGARGYLEGIAVGVILTTILFVVNYSRIGVVKYALSGVDFRSRVTRSLSQQQIIQARGGKLYILKLQGYLFFGTANKLLERAQAGATPSLQFLVLDFAQVLDLDSTALLSFSRMRQWAQARGITLLLTGLSGHAQAQFTRGGFVDGTGIQVFFDLDHGVEWCENQILQAEAAEQAANSGVGDMLRSVIHSPELVHALMAAMDRRTLTPGEVLIRQGDQADHMYFVESGQVSAQLEQPGKPSTRLEAVRGGRAVGELGFYLDTQRTASVIADEPTVVYVLTRDALNALEEAQPEVASALHRVIVRLLGERVTHLIRTVEVLQR
jgi:SulP family sulfate permease